MQTKQNLAIEIESKLQINNTMVFDFGELKNDDNFVSKVQSTAASLKKIEEAIKMSAEMKIDELSTEDKVKYDLFLIYAANSLFWMYLKGCGLNPSTVSHHSPILII